MKMNENHGVEVTVRCEKPQDVTRKMYGRARREWWERCKRLQAGALTCILNAQGMVRFFVVAESTLRVEKKQETEDGGASRHHDAYILSSDPDYLYICQTRPC